MTDFDKLLAVIKDIALRYELEILYFDFTDVTLLARIGISSDIFIQIDANLKKQKVNFALVVANDRIYGIDKEGGYYHEHPFENPALHIKTDPIEIEDFVIKSLEYLKKSGLI